MKMKKTIIYLIVAAIGLSCLCACREKLEIPYNNVLSASNMWQDPSDLEQSVPCIYEQLRTFFQSKDANVFYYGEVRLGDYMWGQSRRGASHNTYMICCRHQTMTPSNTISWANAYHAIDQANAVLAHSAECNAADAMVKWANAQAYFARAFAYFYIVRLWGDVPLNLLPVEGTGQEETYPFQATPAETYAQIGRDIEACEACGDVLGNEKYLGTKDALNMLKAEYALWMYSTQNGGNSYLSLAETALNAIGISGSKLLPDYSKIFSRTNKKNAEVIFALNNTPTNTGGYQSYFCFASKDIKSNFRQNPVPVNSTQWWDYSDGFMQQLLDSKAAGDSRVDTNLGIGNYAADGSQVTWCNKLLGDMSGSAIVFDNDLLYYRYALAVMMFAELKYYQGQYDAALNALNLIAKRAYGKENVYTSSSQNDVLDAIVKEYFLEFPAEGVIWWALIRTGKIWEYVPNKEFPEETFADLRARKANILLWPIPQSSLNRNTNLHQIAGWE